MSRSTRGRLRTVFGLSNITGTRIFSINDICHRCCASTLPGMLNYLEAEAFPAKSHQEYMDSAAARESPLTALVGFHISMTGPEPMHVGPLGAMPDAAGSALLELCDSGCFGFVGVTLGKPDWIRNSSMRTWSSHVGPSTTMSSTRFEVSRGQNFR